MTNNRIAGARRPLLGLLVVGLVAVGCTSAAAKAAEMGASCDQFGAQKSITQTTEVAVGSTLVIRQNCTIADAGSANAARSEVSEEPEPPAEPGPAGRS